VREGGLEVLVRIRTFIAYGTRRLTSEGCSILEADLDHFDIPAKPTLAKRAYV
jgi:hypothetical protein